MSVLDYINNRLGISISDSDDLDDLKAKVIEDLVQKAFQAEETHDTLTASWLELNKVCQALDIEIRVNEGGLTVYQNGNYIAHHNDIEAVMSALRSVYDTVSSCASKGKKK